MTHESGNQFPLFFEHRHSNDFVGYLFGREEYLAAPGYPIEFFWKEEQLGGSLGDFLVARSFRGKDNIHRSPSDLGVPWMA